LSHLKLADFAATEPTRFLPEFSVLENSNQLKDESNNTKSHKRNSTIWNPPSGHQVDLRGHSRQQPSGGHQLRPRTF